MGLVRRPAAPQVVAIPEVAASASSACHAGRIERSPVLEAMGIAPHVGMGAIRFGLGRGTTGEEIDRVVLDLKQAVAPADQAPGS